MGDYESRDARVCVPYMMRCMGQATIIEALY